MNKIINGFPEKKKKVIILNHGLASGGTDAFVVNLVTHLDRSHFEPIVCLALESNCKQFRDDEVKADGIPILYTNDLGSIKRIIQHSKRLYHILRNEKPQVFHANMDLLNGINLFIAWLAKVPIRVCHSHTSSSQYETKHGSNNKMQFYKRIMKWMIWRFSNRRCGCSKVAMDYLFDSRWRNDRNSWVIYNGIDLSLFMHSDDKISDKKRELGIVKVNKVLITVGMLSKVKNQMFLLEVVKKMKQIRNDFKLVIVGDGELRTELEKTVNLLEISEFVLFLGRRHDVNEILSCADVFLLPSLFEGLPIALIEAQAANLPCIVSNTITREVDCGLCEYLSLDSIDEWVSKTNEILNSEKTYDYNERIKEFDVAYMVKKMERIY